MADTTTDSVTINVATPFTLTLDDHTTQTFTAGQHKVPAATATHWYVQAHATIVASPEAPADADADALTAALEAEAKNLETNQDTAAAAEVEAAKTAIESAAVETKKKK